MTLIERMTVAAAIIFGGCLIFAPAVRLVSAQPATSELNWLHTRVTTLESVRPGERLAVLETQIGDIRNAAAGIFIMVVGQMILTIVGAKKVQRAVEPRPRHRQEYSRSTDPPYSDE